MFIAMDKDGSIWAFSLKPILDLKGDSWIPDKKSEYFSIPEEACSICLEWTRSLKCPECNEYEVAQGEVFEINGFSYECIPAKLHSCKECTFNDIKSLCVRAPECLGIVRHDRTDVYFKCIE